MISFFLPFIRMSVKLIKNLTIAIGLLAFLYACSNVAPRASENVVWDQQRELLEELGACN